jgi:hypothetical protein
MDTRDAPCPCCGHLLWFSNNLPSDDLGHAAKWSSSKELVIKIGTERLGPPNDAVQATMNQLHPSKFAKVEWEGLLRVKNWDDVLSLVNITKR